jgi:hypothetical protein
LGREGEEEKEENRVLDAQVAVPKIEWVGGLGVGGLGRAKTFCLGDKIFGAVTCEWWILSVCCGWLRCSGRCCAVPGFGGLILTLLEQLSHGGTHEREGNVLRQDKNQIEQMLQLHGIGQVNALVNQQTSS